MLASGYAKRILFLVDRKSLAAQAVTAFASFDTPRNIKFKDMVYGGLLSKLNTQNKITKNAKMVEYSVTVKVDGLRKFLVIHSTGIWLVYGKEFCRICPLPELWKEYNNSIFDGEDINDIAVLYRNNSHADYVENELKKRNIKYCISENKGFFDRKEVKLIVSYLKLLDDPHNDENFDILFNLRNHPIMYIKKNSNVI
jgi:hypothetical protein